MRDRWPWIVLVLILAATVGVWACLLAPAEWHWDGIYKHAYWPFTVEIAVRDR